MVIERFRVERLRNEELVGFHARFSDLVESYGAEWLHIDILYPTYKTYCREADQLVELLQKSFITADIAVANRERYMAFRGLRNTVKAYLCVFDTSKQTAAVKIYTLIEKYSKTILKGSVDAKTSATDNMLHDLIAGEGAIDLSEEVGLLNLSGWVNDLGKANTDYKNSISQRVFETIGRPETGRLLQVRARMNHYYVNMINIIDAYLLALGTTNSTQTGEEDENAPKNILQFAKALNACIIYYKSLLKGRHTHSIKKK